MKNELTNLFKTCGCHPELAELKANEALKLNNMEQENKIRKALHELQEKYRINREHTNKIETDACVKFNNAELYISGIGYMFKFSIGYSEPFKEVVISEYEFTHELYNENCKLLFAKLYTDLIEFIDIWNAETQALNIPVSTGICQHCGKQEGDYCINPYIKDVNGREEWEYICSDCYRELVADI